VLKSFPGWTQSSLTREVRLHFLPLNFQIFSRFYYSSLYLRCGLSWSFALIFSKDADCVVSGSMLGILKFQFCMHCILYMSVEFSFFWHVTPRYWIIFARRFEMMWWSRLQESVCPRIYQNLSHQLPSDTVQSPRILKTSTTPLRKPKISHVFS
jgi:hypothetical protein